MPNRNLSPEERAKAWDLLGRIKAEIVGLAAGDDDLLFAYTRKVGKELSYFERGTPMLRRKLKREKMTEQNGQCAICKATLPPTYNVLDRLNAAGRYTAANTRLLCAACDTKVQRDRGYR